jgi:aryl-alcohol dehydrogenase-like predicted oxidoreductase
MRMGPRSTRAPHDPARAPDFTRSLGALGSVSALAIGTALGEPTDAEDARYEEAIDAAIAAGITLVDTAINYRCQRSEKSVGRALEALATSASRAPDDRSAGPILVCTKGGYIPLESPPPATKDEYRAYVRATYVDAGIIVEDELVAGGHCIAPAFLEDQVRRSRANLGRDAIDLYYLHNPEQQLEGGVSRELFQRRLRDAFAALEACVETGAIRAYGCATWQGLRTSPDAANHLSLEEIVRTAHEVAGDAHHLTAVQIPVSLAMPEALRVATQTVRGAPRTALEAADELGIAVVVGAALMHGQLARDLPPAARTVFPDAPSDAARALTFVRMLPHVACVVVGMRSPDHVRENVGVFSSAL